MFNQKQLDRIEAKLDKLLKKLVRDKKPPSYEGLDDGQIEYLERMKHSK